MSAPTDLHYTRDHEWVRVDGTEATVGITQYAADQLGDIVFVELPEAGRDLEEAKPFGVVESVKAVSDLFAPISRRGHVDERRPRDEPELVNSDPYGAGWMVRMTRGRPGPARRPARRPGLRRSSSRRADATMPYGPHTTADRAADAGGPRPR